jgi:hypothetical protein
MEDNNILTDKFASHTKLSEILKFQYNENFKDEISVKKKFNKGKTITTFNSDENKIIKDIIEKFGCSMGSTESKNTRFSRKMSRNAFPNRGKNRLRKFLTFTEDRINMLKQMGNTTNVNINININKIELEKTSVIDITPTAEGKNAEDKK